MKGNFRLLIPLEANKTKILGFDQDYLYTYKGFSIFLPFPFLILTCFATDCASKLQKLQKSQFWVFLSNNSAKIQNSKTYFNNFSCISVKYHLQEIWSKQDKVYNGPRDILFNEN